METLPLWPTSVNCWPALVGRTLSYRGEYPSPRGPCAIGGPAAVRCPRIFSIGFACTPRQLTGCPPAEGLDPKLTLYRRPAVSQPYSLSRHG
jgi:hypothetical protein